MSISALGAAGAPLVMAPTMEQFGWRAVFLLSGVVGLMTAVVWFVLMPADALAGKPALPPAQQPLAG